MFASPDVKEKKETNLNDLSSLGESKCCIGGVDFVTLVCAFLFTYYVNTGMGSLDVHGKHGN